MLPRRLRLSRDGFIGNTPQKRVSSVFFSGTYTERPNNGGCAVVVSKKVAKLAVQRHRIKRRVLAVILPYCSTDRALVVYAKAGSDTLSTKSLKEELVSLLNRLGVTKYQ